VSKPDDRYRDAIRRCPLAQQPALWQEQRRLARRLARQQPADRVRERLERAISTGMATIAQRERDRPVVSYDDTLPVSRQRDEIAALIERHQVVIVCGETGSGKTTQLPKICLDLGRGIRGRIGHTQPRRLAARSVAARIATELGDETGQAVGYKVRFHDRVGPASYVKLMTDGILLAEIQSDRLLHEYDTLIIDEAHERSLNIDFLLGYLKTILPQRPELKLIITSATIDPDSFARFFDAAPVINVSGRSYPVETRYRPLVSDDPDRRDRDMLEGILQAVDELAQDDPHGDILIFVSGEREIREAAEALRKHHPPQVEILPLYSRLAAREQDRIFRPGNRRRLIIATNVAETSLTVPGIRHVIDTGLARISRYSHRGRVQRLPVEAVSRASADQRRGRCGRTAPGVCIRLYAEDDYAQRPAFTDPEILRTNLASVILQMAHLRLGRIEEFAFIDAPDPRVVRDGYRLLQELDALDEEQRITPLGRQLARLPVDPRLARMLLAADEFDSLDEVLVIVAALSIQDPRERPHDRREQAAQAHAVFRDDSSDFLALHALWRAFREQQRHLSQNKLRQWCRGQFLAWMRMREWLEIHKQLSGMLREMGYHPNTTEATYEEIHRALLAGLVSHVGQRQERADYLGPRGRQFRLAPDSALARKSPPWVVSAELVETHRLIARMNARIEPHWIEQAAGEHCLHSYLEPHWDQRQGRVMAWEQVSLYGLVIIPRRRVHFGPREPELARELFIRGALVEGRYRSRADFLEHNRELLQQIEAIEHKRRRHDLRVDDEIIYRYYDARIPAGICTGRAFEHWLKQAMVEQPDLLRMQRKDLLLQRSDDHAAQFPDHLEHAGIDLPLSYRFEPGHPLDGVTVHVPLHHLNAIDSHVFDWLVPGLIRDKLTVLLKGLPKPLRRLLVPVPETVTLCLEHMQPRHEPLTATLARTLHQQKGVRTRTEDWDGIGLPAHLRMNYRLLDADGKTLAVGRDLARLKAEFGANASTAFAGVPDWRIQCDNVTRWDFGSLPPEIRQRHGDSEVVGYPALTIEGERVALRVHDAWDEAQHQHHAGVHALILKLLPEQARLLRRNLPDLKRQCLLYAAVGNCASLHDDLVATILDGCFTGDADLPRDEAAFNAMLAAGRGRVVETATKLCWLNLECLELYHQVGLRLASAAQNLSAASRADIRAQLDNLIYPGYLQHTGIHGIRNYPRYLKAVLRRLEKAGQDPAREQTLLRQLEPPMSRYLAAVSRWHELTIEQQVALTEYHAMLEEWRVSLFAQELGTARPASLKRLETQWRESGL